MTEELKSKSLVLAEALLGKEVNVTVDRPLGSLHPKHGFKYEINYGYINGLVAPDGEELDAYVIDVITPIDNCTGKVIAIVHRLKDDDDKLVIATTGKDLTNDEIEERVNFQEQWFEHEIIRLKP